MVTRKSETTKTRILEASVEEFINSGFVGFTIQGVARRANISVGNLTYHYSHRDALIQGMIFRWMTSCRQKIDELFSSAKNGGETDLLVLVEWLIEFAQKKDFARVFAELRAMANHDQQVSELVHTLYDNIRDRLLTELADGCLPESQRDLKHTLLLLTTLMAGVGVLLANRPEYDLQRNDIKEITCKTIVKLLPENIFFRSNQQ
jgi:AcrR family transcriptional regulator